MTKIENVVKALECCQGERQCDTCPYNTHGADDCDGWLLFDAARLLKQQRPRILTLDEAKEVLRNDPVICIEAYDKMTYGVRMDGTDYFLMQTDEIVNIDDLDNDEFAAGYGTVFRMWKR